MEENVPQKQQAGEDFNPSPACFSKRFVFPADLTFPDYSRASLSV